MAFCAQDKASSCEALFEWVSQRTIPVKTNYNYDLLGML